MAPKTFQRYLFEKDLTPLQRLRLEHGDPSSPIAGFRQRLGEGSYGYIYHGRKFMAGDQLGKADVPVGGIIKSTDDGILFKKKSLGWDSADVAQAEFDKQEADYKAQKEYKPQHEGPPEALYGTKTISSKDYKSLPIGAVIKSKATGAYYKKNQSGGNTYYYWGSATKSDFDAQHPRNPAGSAQGIGGQFKKKEAPTNMEGGKQNPYGGMYVTGLSPKENHAATIAKVLGKPAKMGIHYRRLLAKLIKDSKKFGTPPSIVLTVKQKLYDALDMQRNSLVKKGNLSEAEKITAIMGKLGAEIKTAKEAAFKTAAQADIDALTPAPEKSWVEKELEAGEKIMATYTGLPFDAWDKLSKDQVSALTGKYGKISTAYAVLNPQGFKESQGEDAWKEQLKEITKNGNLPIYKIITGPHIGKIVKAPAYILTDAPPGTMIYDIGMESYLTKGAGGAWPSSTQAQLDALGISQPKDAGAATDPENYYATTDKGVKVGWATQDMTDLPVGTSIKAKMTGVWWLKLPPQNWVTLDSQAAQDYLKAKGKPNLDDFKTVVDKLKTAGEDPYTEVKHIISSGVKAEIPLADIIQHIEQKHLDAMNAAGYHSTIESLYNKSKAKWVESLAQMAQAEKGQDAKKAAQNKYAAELAAQKQKQLDAAAAQKKAKQDELDKIFKDNPEVKEHYEAMFDILGGKNATKEYTAKIESKLKYSGLHKYLAPEEALPIYAYTGSHYGEFNRNLRNGTMDESWFQYAVSLRAALNKLPDWTGITIRRTSVGTITSKYGSPKNYYVPGRVIHELGFASTSHTGSWDGPWTINIKSKHGKLVEKLSASGEHEHEVLFKNDSYFKITGFDQKTQTIDMEELDYNADEKTI